MRPVLKKGLRQLWRDETTLQIGLDPNRALVVGGLRPEITKLLPALDGCHTQSDLRRVAQRLGVDASVVDRLLGFLLEGCVIDDAGQLGPVLADLPRDEQDRLAPDVSSLSIVSGALDGGSALLARRRRTAVGIVGAGRVGASVATLLAAAGVGRVVVDDQGRCAAADCAPAGSSVTEVGSRRDHAAAAALRRVSRSVRTDPRRPGERFDLVVLAPTGAAPHDVGDELLRTNTPHLFAAVREVTGVVGPLVVPGKTACLRCLDLHRVDRDPAWPLLAAQLATDAQRSPAGACDVALATLVASVCALQALSFVDGLGGTPVPGSSAANATFEATLPDWRMRRRQWSLHPACGCHWFGESESDLENNFERPRSATMAP